MNQFASGFKQSYYGKGDVTAYRLNRDGKTPAGQNPVFGANVLMLLYGDAFWPTYTTGDNANLIATDSMKNFIQRETLNFPGYDLESYVQFLSSKFMGLYPQTEGIQVSAVEVPYQGIVEGGVAFVPAGPEVATSRIELKREGTVFPVVELRSGLKGFKLLRMGGSAFYGFVRDEYTTLPETKNRPLQMWMDLEWGYISPAAAFTEGVIIARVRKMVHEVFNAFESGSIQQVIYQLGARMLAEIPAISEVSLEANNRTWDTVIDAGDKLGLYTDPRPPYGCLGLTLKR